MKPKEVTATEFREHAGLWLDEAGKAPVIVTKHKRPSRVIMDYEAYQRLMASDTRRVLKPTDLDETTLSALERSEMDPSHEDLDKLLK